jgi:hypothetical protein
MSIRIVVHHLKDLPPPTLPIMETIQKDSEDPENLSTSTASQATKEHKNIINTVQDHADSVNPQATLGGLPTELRLQIYDYLCESSIIHLSCGPHGKLTWTPCWSTDPEFPLLCSATKRSRLFNEENRCSNGLNAPQEQRGCWALAASNKIIRSEAKEYLLCRSVISIQIDDLHSCLKQLTEHRAGQLRRITVEGGRPPQLFQDIRLLRLLIGRIPNLEAVGLQRRDNYDSAASWRFRALRWMRVFDPSITVAMEAIPKPGAFRVDQPTSIRILNERISTAESAARAASGHKVKRNRVVKVEVETPRKLVLNKNAGWMIWPRLSHG